MANSSLSFKEVVAELFRGRWIVVFQVMFLFLIFDIGVIRHSMELQE